MDFLKPEPKWALDELRAMTMVARAARNGLGRPQRAVLGALQRILLGTDSDVDTLAPIDAEDLLSIGMDGAQARQLIRLMVVLSVAEGAPSEEQVRLMSTFASALCVEEPAVRVVGHLAKGRVMRFKFAFARHAHIRIYMRNTRKLHGGILQAMRAVLRFRGVLPEDAELAARFHAFGDFPEETLGYHFYRHCRDADLPFSGEKGGFPMGALYHDFTHVLAGYDTSPEGEMKAAAFQAGFTTDPDDFFTVLFALIIHTAGINLTPFEMPVLLGRIGQGQLAMEVLHALERGAATKVDLGRDWNFWEDVNVPIDAVRERIGISPLQPEIV